MSIPAAYTIPKHRKAIWGWAIYDWANSAFATTVMTGLFPAFFKQFWNQGVDVNLSTARLGLGNALASLMVALMAPILGAIADHSSRKGFLIAFTYLGVLMTAALSLVAQSGWIWALSLYILGVVGYTGGIVFYDALLPQVAPDQHMNSVSSLGFALGYLGGGLLFTINVLMTLKPHLFGLADTTQAVRIAFISVALWWGIFALITFQWVPSEPRPPKSRKINPITGGWRQLIKTLKKIRHFKTLCLFLLAYWFYIDGVHTVVRMAVDYGMSIGFHFKDLIIALLITQFISFPSALTFGALGQRWGARRCIYLALSVYILVTFWGACMTRPVEFYILAGVVGLVQGGIQALSRSYYAHLIPHRQSAEFFGFYNMLGKFAAIIGPVLMAMTGLALKSLLLPQGATAKQIHTTGLMATRLSIASVVLLFIVGAIILYFVDEKKAKAEMASLNF